MHSLKLPLALITLFAASQAMADDTWRCNSTLVSVGDSTTRVARKCGEPPSKTAPSFMRVPNYRGGFSDVQVEQWTYGPDSGMYHTLRFEGDQLVRITSERD
ncbi:DUF2845 domain-containing protein [Pseudomonas sp. KNUC1026]|uniref:DUF2845 domain-containing protein n=1 Tax=Pseudomonas sp. KNUC1026 TaxID=2893890 RepID=UPI001F2D6ED1|nr:DUF2845 domain-containing protein [Pseudomonas sp. KNUC1026]UFH50127.1 DUF2845 domain-containing protein [Pseudomonas sp. KNUC1026]